MTQGTYRTSELHHSLAETRVQTARTRVPGKHWHSTRVQSLGRRLRRSSKAASYLGGVLGRQFAGLVATPQSTSVSVDRRRASPGTTIPWIEARVAWRQGSRARLGPAVGKLPATGHAGLRCDVAAVREAAEDEEVGVAALAVQLQAAADAHRTRLGLHGRLRVVLSAICDDIGQLAQQHHLPLAQFLRALVAFKLFLREIVRVRHLGEYGRYIVCVVNVVALLVALEVPVADAGVAGRLPVLADASAARKTARKSRNSLRNAGLHQKFVYFKVPA